MGPKASIFILLSDPTVNWTGSSPPGDEGRPSGGDFSQLLISAEQVYNRFFGSIRPWSFSSQRAFENTTLRSKYGIYFSARGLSRGMVSCVHCYTLNDLGMTRFPVYWPQLYYRSSNWKTGRDASDRFQTVEGSKVSWALFEWNNFYLCHIIFTYVEILHEISSRSQETKVA